MSSIFTKIINREIPSDIVFENETIIVIKDINPEAKTHLLIIPKKEIETINDLEPEDTQLIADMFLLLKKLQMIYEYQSDINCISMFEKSDDKKLCIYIFIYYLIFNLKWN